MPLYCEMLNAGTIAHGKEGRCRHVCVERACLEGGWAACVTCSGALAGVGTSVRATAPPKWA